MENRTLRKEKTNPGKMILILLLTVVVLTAGNWCYTEYIVPSLQPLANEIEFEDWYFVLDEEDLVSKSSVYDQVIVWYNRFFTKSDHGGVWVDTNEELHFNLVKNAPQRENIARFLALANAELEQNGFVAVQTHEVQFSEQELIDQSSRLADELMQNSIPFHSIGPDTINNRIIIGYDDISFSYQAQVLMHIDSQYVLFKEMGPFVTD